MRASRALAAIAVALFALASAGPARALTLTPECVGGCFGVDIVVDVTLTSVQLSMDFENYVGSASSPPGHSDLEAIAFKLYTNDDVTWTFVSGSLDSNPFSNFDSFVNGGLSDGGCNGSGMGWDCFVGTPGFDIIAAGRPTLTLNYSISNADALLGEGASSFKAEFGSATDNGWLISETMIPEPTGAALFLVGGVVMSSAIRRRA